MAIPANISTRWVEGQFLTNVNDGPDPDQQPDSLAAQGIVTFVAAVPYLPDPTAEPNPATMLMIPRVAVLDEEGYLCTPVRGTLTPAYRGIMLECTDDPDGSVTGWTWNVKYTFMPADGVTPIIDSHSFPLPASDVALDLTTVVKVPSSAGIGKEQAEVLAASAQAAAVRAAADAAKAMAAAEEALGAAVATDSNVSSLVGTEGTETNAAVARQVETATASKLDTDEAASTYQSIDGLDAVAASKVNAENTSLRQAVDARAQAAASSKLDATEAADTFQTIADLDTATAAKVNASNTSLRQAVDSRAQAAAASKLDAAEAANTFQTMAGLDGASARLVGSPLSVWWLALVAKLTERFSPRGELVVSVKDFGAKGDNQSDDLAAFNAAYQAVLAKGGGMIYIPAGKYRLSGEWNIYRPNSPRRDIVIRGESQWTTFVLADFSGAGKALIQASDPTGNTRCSPTSLYHLQLGVVRASDSNPVLLDILGFGESRLESLRFGSVNNTAMRLGAGQNVRMRDIVSFYGGKHYNYRDASAVTFSTVAGGNVVTASADIFTGSDPGRTMTLLGPSSRLKFQIGTFVDARTVRVNVTTPAYTAITGVFEPARISTQAGSNQVTANAQVFTQEQIGTVIYIEGARSGPWGPALLRAKIMEVVSGATVRLDVPAGNTVTRSEFTTPAIEIYAPSTLGSISADTNDLKLELLHVENNRGVGLVVQNSVFMHINDFKIHGEHGPTSSQASTAQMWLDDYAGTLSGELDGAATGDHRILLCNMNDLLTFDWLATRRILNEKIFQIDAMTDPGGIAEVRTFHTYGAAASGDPYELVDDVNIAPRLVYTGLVNMLGDNDPPRIYAGKDTYFTMQGGLVTKSPDGTRYRLSIANGGVVSATPA